MATQIAPPPTYCNPVEYNKETGQVSFNPIWLQWFVGLANGLSKLEVGITVTITTAALTSGGSQGSMTFQNGILVGQTQAT